MPIEPKRAPDRNQSANRQTERFRLTFLFIASFFALALFCANRGWVGRFLTGRHSDQLRVVCFCVFVCMSVEHYFS